MEMSHIMFECSTLAESEYKRKIRWGRQLSTWCLNKKYGLLHSQLWYQHIAEPVSKNDGVKLFRDVNVYTDHVIKGCRPDIVVVDKDECLVKDITYQEKREYMDERR